MLSEVRDTRASHAGPAATSSLKGEGVQRDGGGWMEEGVSVEGGGGRGGNGGKGGREKGWRRHSVNRRGPHELFLCKLAVGKE